MGGSEVMKVDNGGEFCAPDDSYENSINMLTRKLKMILVDQWSDRCTKEPRGFGKCLFLKLCFRVCSQQFATPHLAIHVSLRFTWECQEMHVGQTRLF